MAMIQLYNRDDTDFKGHNGKILSEVYDDTISWELNTKFEFEFSYPLFGKFGLAIQREMVVTAPVPGYDDQAFRVDQVTKSMGVLTVHAYHVFWDLMQNFIEDTNIVNKDGNGAVSQIMTHTQFAHEFSYSSTVGNISNARIVRMSVIAALIGTDDNALLSRWGGEFEWDNFHFNHVAQLGEDRGVVFRNGKNLLGYKATEDLTDTVTRIMPEGYNGLFLPEKYVDSPLIGNYGSPRIAKIEYSDIKAIDEDSVSADNDDKALPVDQALDSLRAACRREFDIYHIDQPTTTYELNVVMLEDTKEYKDSGIFSRVYPGDTATFIHTDDKLNVKARMTGYTWQPSVGQYLTLTFNSKQRNSPDVEHKVDQISEQLTVVDKTATSRSANNANTVGWSVNPPVAIKGNKEGDLWYQQSGIHVIMWIFHDGAWTQAVSDIAGQDASNLIGGAINAANINVINLNADNLVAGTIRGGNMRLSLNDGRFESTDENNENTLGIDNGKIMYSTNSSGGSTTGQISFNKMSAFSWYLNFLRENIMLFEAINGAVALTAPSTSRDDYAIGRDASVMVVDDSVMITSSNTLDWEPTDDDYSNCNSIIVGNDEDAVPDFRGIKLYVDDPNDNISLTVQSGTMSGTNPKMTISSDDVNINCDVVMEKSLSIGGDLNVNGAKNAIHITRDGVRATPAYETAESYLGDIGEATTDDTKSVHIPIETLFGDTVNTSIPYQVFLQSYSAAHVWVSSRDEAFFTVESDQPNAPFSWELKAKRRGYENDRLVKTDMTYEDYGKANGFKGDEKQDD